MGQPEARVAAVLTFSAPAFLLAGALAALVPLALHLIRRRPPARAPLPTQRFLTPDPRTSVRVSRPTDVLLLALRMLLLVLAGAAFSRPVWHPKAEGTSEIVLLDRGAAMTSGDGWRQAVAAARQRLLSADGSPRGALVLVDTAAIVVPRRHVTPALFDSLASASPSAATSRYAAALRAIPATARDLRGADSLRVTLVTRPTWGGWSDGIAPLRRAVWPGAIGLVALPAAPAADSASPDSVDAGHAIVLAADGDANTQYPVAALGSLGWDVETRTPLQPLGDSADLILVTTRLDAGQSRTVADAARRGATVVMDANGDVSVADLTLWRGDASAVDDTLGGTIRFADGLAVPGAVSRVAGTLARDAAMIAAWDDGRPAAVARRLDRGCVVFVGTYVDRGEMVLGASYPRLLGRLARGCASTENTVEDGEPLDAGARAVLAGAGPSAVAARTLAATGGGMGLGRWLMGVALLAAATETFLAYRRKRQA